ncbi:hypothetical protein Salat_1465000 [Sesamum alatum]|uniref:Uncharacterized protein n=1 Tax=Sesamum alatum TaxID=300844 RepID=A0AAE2CLV2_9LAMI|nr:hypothetical protein Salat_1465000 [Sesamum alatum]
MDGGAEEIWAEDEERAAEAEGENVTLEFNIVAFASVVEREAIGLPVSAQWVHHPDFMTVVAASWESPTSCVGMVNLTAKLKRLKHRLKAWNKEVFGDIFAHLNAAEGAAT